MPDEVIESVATDIKDEKDILTILEVLGGIALLGNNRRLYEHIYAAKVRYEDGQWLNGNGPST
jgi:hypothetical protein